MTLYYLEGTQCSVIYKAVYETQKYCRVTNTLSHFNRGGTCLQPPRETSLQCCSTSHCQSLQVCGESTPIFQSCKPHFFFIGDMPWESFHITGIQTHWSQRTGHLVTIQILWGYLSTDEIKDKIQAKLLLTKKTTGYFMTKLETKMKGKRGEQQSCQGIPKTHLCCLLLHMNFPWNFWELPWPQSLQKDTTKPPFTPYHSSQQATFLITILS